MQVQRWTKNRTKTEIMIKTLTCPYCGKQKSGYSFAGEKRVIYYACAQCRYEMKPPYHAYSSVGKTGMDKEFKLVRLAIIEKRLAKLPILSLDAEVLILERNSIRL